MTALLWMLLAPAPAQEPDDGDARARLLYENGAALYAEGLYEPAIEAFRQALDLSGHHELLYNIANAQERLGDLEGARESLGRYRIYVEPSERETLERRIRALERRIGEEEAMLATPVPVPVPVPLVTTRPNPAKWVLFGVGAAVATGAGTMAAVTYASGRGFAEAGDEAAYRSARTVNNVSLPVAGLGAGAAVIGIALPGQRPVSASED